MKQTLAMLFVTALLLFSLAGCGEKKDSQHRQWPVDRYDRQRRGGQRQKKG